MREIDDIYSKYFFLGNISLYEMISENKTHYYVKYILSLNKITKKYFNQQK